MKTLIAAVVLSLISQLVVAQKSFEGKITYISKSLVDKNSTEKSLIYFSQNKLRIKNEIYDLSNGEIYFIHKGNMSCSKERMSDHIVDTSSSWVAMAGMTKNISGYSCTGYKRYCKNKEDTTDGIKYLYWFADSLVYYIPSEYKNVDGLIPFCNGEKINLGIDVSTKMGNEAEKIAYSYAIVEPDKIPASYFNIPDKNNLIEISNLRVDKQESKKYKKSKRRRIGGTE